MKGLLIILAVFTVTSTFLAESTPEAEVGRGIGLFTIMCDKWLSKDADNENLITSSASTAMVLAMASFGAKGNTKTEIRKALNCPESDEITKNGILNYLKAYEKLEKKEMKVANRIYINTVSEIKPEFQNITNNIFKAEAQSLDFYQAEQASKTINDWVQEKTNNKIMNFLKPDDIKDKTMILTSATYFNAKWQYPFNPSNTGLKAFHYNESTTKDIPTMHQHGHFLYGDLTGANAKFVILPFMSSHDDIILSMYFIVPNEINGLRQVGNDLEKVYWDKVFMEAKVTNLHIDMPKFKIESKSDFKPILKKLGVNDMFDDKANFSGILDSPVLKVTDAMQKAFIDINEEGSEVAAATAFSFAPGSGAPNPEDKEVHFKIDRPFIFSIAMQTPESRTVLYYGRVVDPKY